MDEGLAARDFRARLKAVLATADDAARLDALRSLADSAPGYVETIQLDKALAGVAPEAVDKRLTRVRVAILSSATIDHLLPGLRVAAMRRGFCFEVFAGAFGQYRQELLDPATRLQAFDPEVVVLSLSARALVGALPIDADPEHVEQLLQTEIAEVRGLWGAARQRFGAVVLQQTYIDTFEPLFGSYDRIAAARPRARDRSAQRILGQSAREDGVAARRCRRRSARDGIDAWFDAARWLQGKMEIAPQAAGRWGELLARIMAAQRGLSKQVPGARPGQHPVGRRHRRRSARRHRARRRERRRRGVPGPAALRPAAARARRDPRRLLQERAKRSPSRPSATIPRCVLQRSDIACLRRQLAGQGRPTSRTSPTS